MKRSAKALEIKRRANPAPSNAKAPSDTAQDDLPLVGRTPAMQTLYRLVAPRDEHRSAGVGDGGKRDGKKPDRACNP